MSQCYRPYLIDLDSTNGSYINSERVEPARYYELKEKVRVHVDNGGIAMSGFPVAVGHVEVWI